MKKRLIEGLKHFNQVVKDDKLVSRLLPQLGVPYGDTAGDVAAALGYGKKKKAVARKPRSKKGKGVSFSADAKHYPATSHSSEVQRRLAELERAVGDVGLVPPPTPPVRSARASGSMSPELPISRPRSGRGKKRAPKRGKGFGDFLKGLIQAPLAGVAATAGGLHGALGGFGKKRIGRGKKPTHMLIKL